MDNKSCRESRQGDLLLAFLSSPRSVAHSGVRRRDKKEGRARFLMQPRQIEKKKGIGYMIKEGMQETGLIAVK